MARIGEPSLAGYDFVGHRSTPKMSSTHSWGKDVGIFGTAAGVLLAIVLCPLLFVRIPEPGTG